MENITDIHLVCDFNHLDEIDLIYGEKFELTILYNEVPYDFLLDLKEDSENLVVLLTSALPSGKKNTADKPIYRRWTWNLPESSICCNDPTYYLSEGLNGGFYLGKKDDWYLNNIALILKIIFDKLQLNNEQVLFYGSSMGGTAAIMLSTLLPNSISIADIPILDIKNNIHWKDIKKYCFENENIGEFIQNFNYRLNVIDLFNREHFIPNTYLLMDFSVESDCVEQYIPFFNSLKNMQFDKKDLNMKIRIDRKQMGHFPLNEYDFNELLNKVLSNNKGISYENTIINPKFLSSLLKFLKARIDIKNCGNEKNSVKILSISDNNSKITKPLWFKNEQGIGINITSIVGYLNMKVKCEQDGEFHLYLRSIDFRDINRKRLQIYLIFEYLKINNEDIFVSDKTISHDHPYHYKKKVLDGEIIEIKMKWRSFDSFGKIHDI